MVGDEDPMDVLADVLRALRLRGTAYFQGQFRAPWGMQLDRHEVANFHVVVEGSCAMRCGDELSVEMNAGDIVVFPHGASHSLADNPGADAPAASTLLATRREEGGKIVFGRDGASTEIICGHFELDRGGTHPLLDALPPVILLRSGTGTHPEWIATATRLAVLESGSERPGSAAVVDRLAEALMIQVIRAHAELQGTQTGFLVALSDRLIGPALEAIHAQPSHPWSVEGLASDVGASRSTFATRFKEVLGTSVMQYVTDWRMHCARDLLRADGLSIAHVAEQVGYQSEFAFAKAFKRVFGQGPGAARRAG